MNKHLQALVNAVKKGRGLENESEKISVSKTSRTAGSAYEKIRNAVEYEEEHLLRRNAIRRILRRRRDIGESDESRGSALLNEMIWAKYLPNNAVPVSLVSQIDAIISRHDVLFNALPEGEAGEQGKDWLLDVLSTEIEYAIEPPRAAEALANFMFDRISGGIEWKETKMQKKEERDMLLYIAIHRALLKSNVATLRYRLFALYVPDWSSRNAEEAKEVASRLVQLARGIESHIHHPLSDQLFRLMRRHAFVFSVISDVVRDKPEQASEILSDEDEFRKKILKAAEARYGAFKTRLRRTVLRAVVFLFLTKMLLAIILELPYDAYILGELSWLPLGINIVFHPIFLAVIGTTVGVPVKKNNARLTELAWQAVNGADAIQVFFHVKEPWLKGALGRIFSVVYAMTYALSYGLIAWLLISVLNFNALSTALFLFFFSLVTFFGIKIRQSVRELLVIERQGSLIGTIFDFFLLPVVRVGRWISLRAPKVNIFIFFLDFIVEAPFKLGIEMIEGWIAFMREKKEEL
ncbi:MAG: hypothetical protein AAB886_00495 [Patescibacteria group bacterium]